jgi:hypothetical protein
MSANEECCPRFNPKPWDDKVIVWQNKRFVQDRVTSIFHIPLNYGSVMERNHVVGTGSGPRIVLTDENSMWGADIFVEVIDDLSHDKMTTLSGTFLTRVFEGPYRNMSAWIEDMRKHVAARNKRLKKFYFYYTTCPKCAKKYGKNYVVILAEVDD